MRRIPFLFLLLLCSCISGTTREVSRDQNVRITSLRQLDGTYTDRPVSYDKNGMNIKFLSEIIFPHKRNIEFIRVAAKGESELVIDGLDKNNQVLISQSFAKGKDFTLSGGEVHVASDVAVEGLERQSLGIGLAYTHQSFALDKNGDAILKDDKKTAVMVLAIVPVGLDDTQYMKFKRVQ